MNSNAFECNADFAGIVQSFLNGSVSHSEMYLQAQELFSAKRFECPDLEKAARDENHYVSLLVGEHPLVADDKEFLARWFETFGKLSRGGRFLLKELQRRKRAFNEKNLQYFASKGVNYETALKELYAAGLIEKPLNEKQSPPLSTFALNGMSFTEWQDRLIEFYLNTLVNRVQNIATNERMKQTVGQVPDLKKKWLHSLVGVPRPGHLALHGVTIPVMEKFELHGEDGKIYHVEMPQDPILPASETIGCRCHLAGVVGRFEKT